MASGPDPPAPDSGQTWMAEPEEAPPPAPERILVRGEAVAAVCALGLLASMFALKWFGVDGIPGRTRKVVSTVDAWNGLTGVRWVMLAAVLVALGSVALHVGQRRHGAKTDTSRLLAAVASLAAALVAYRVLIHMPAPQSVVDQKLGALVGLAFALALAACAWETVRHVRAHAPGSEAARRRRTSA